MMHNRMLYGYRNTTAIVRDPVTIGTSIAGAIGITGTAGTYAIIAATYVAITVATSWAINALAPKPDFGTSGTSGLLVNAKSATAPHDFVYGQARKGGTITYYESTGTNNKFLHQIITLAGHEVEEIGDIYINDEVVSVDPSTGLVGGKWENKIRINKHLGDQTTADADLLSESGQIDSSFVGRGISYMYVRFAYDQDVFANGLPLITAVVKGKKVYDPRTDTTAYSNNAALCVRDYLTAAYGLKSNDIDDVAFQTAANVCDEAVTLGGGGTEPRYTMNGVVSANTKHSEILGRMMTACAGTLFWGGGQWRLVAADYTAPTKLLTLDDLRSGINLDTRTNLRDQFNYVQGVFNNAQARWITADYPPFKSAAFVTEDGGEETPLDLELPLTTSAATARRIAKLTLFRAREQMTLTADFGLNALDVQVGEIIALSIERYGWSQKEFEVIGWKFGPNQEAGDLRVTLTLRETSEAAFDWDAEESAIISNNTNLLAFDDVPTPALDAAVIGSRVNNDGTTLPQIGFSWSITDVELVDQFDFQWKLSTDTDWNSITTRTNEYYLAPAISGAAYDYRVRSVNAFGVKSPFASSVSPASTSDDGTTPNAPTGLTASGGQGAVQLSWSAPAQNTDGSDVKDLFQYKVYRNASNNVGTASLVGRVAADTFAESALAAETTYYYWVVAVDYTGNESAESTVASATTDAAAETRGGGSYYIGVLTLPSTSSGAHTDFTAAIGDPVDYDQAWFYTGTLQNPTNQSVWIYEEGSGPDPASSWNFQENVMVGDLLVDGTVTADKVVVDNATIEGDGTGALQIKDLGITTAKIGTAEIQTANIQNGAVTNRFAAFTAGSLSITTSYQLAQSLTIDADGNPVSILFNSGIDGITSCLVDIRVDGVSQRVFALASGHSYYATEGFESGGTVFITNYSLIFYETMGTATMIVTPAAGSRSVQVYVKRSGGESSSPIIKNRFLETTELKR